MRNVSVKEAKADLDALLDAVDAGEDVVIARDGRPAARLTAVPTAKKRRPLGTVKGEIWVGPDFDAPLDADVQAAFDGRGG